MRARSLLDSFNYAFDGVLYAFKTQRNMRLHFLAAAVVLILSLFFKLDKAELMILFLVIALVIVTEMINTAVETVVDLITQELHPMAAIAKNVAAGAVLAAAVVAVVVGYLIFFPKLDPLIPPVITKLQQTPAYLSLVALVLTVGLVIVGKSLTKSGRPIQGGMPSGHTALGTAAATIIACITRNSLIVLLLVLMIFLIAESRIETRVHSLPEVLAGGLVGFFASLLVLQLLR